MKKIITTFILSTALCASIAQDGQKLIYSNDAFSATIPEFQADGKAQIYIKSNDNPSNPTKQIITFYSDDFTNLNELIIDGGNYDNSTTVEQLFKDSQGNSFWNTSTTERTKNYGLIQLNYIDFDQSCNNSRKLLISQTLFNKDNKYEYLQPLLKSETVINEKDTDGDGTIDYKQTYPKYTMIGFNIVSETGNILKTVNFVNSFTIEQQNYFVEYHDLMKINGKLYLCFHGKLGDSWANLIYAITPSTSGIRMMKMEKSSTIATYNLKGQRTNGSKGINIVRMSDGTTKKILVK